MYGIAFFWVTVVLLIVGLIFAALGAMRDTLGGR
jgi:hypothetical protein